MPTLPSPCYVISDLHLGAAPAQVERACLAFLKWLPGRAGSLVINGDLFDFWFEWERVIPRAAFRVLAALADLRDAGVPVLWVAGNHDCWGGAVLREDVGVDYVHGPWEGTLAGWNARIEHGDGLRPVEDRKYRALRAVIRHRFAIGAFRRLHPDFASRVATGSSHVSRTHRPPGDGSGLRDVAYSHLSANPALELVTYGHSHVASLERAPGGGVYANAGSWLEAPRFLRLTPERVELCAWSESAEGECLDSFDRRAEEALAHP